jgi:hypothetical protein
MELLLADGKSGDADLRSTVAGVYFRRQWSTGREPGHFQDLRGTDGTTDSAFPWVGFESLESVYSSSERATGFDNA